MKVLDNSDKIHKIQIRDPQGEDFVFSVTVDSPQEAIDNIRDLFKDIKLKTIHTPLEKVKGVTIVCMGRKSKSTTLYGLTPKEIYDIIVG